MRTKEEILADLKIVRDEVGVELSKPEYATGPISLKALLITDHNFDQRFRSLMEELKQI